MGLSDQITKIRNVKFAAFYLLLTWCMFFLPYALECKENDTVSTQSEQIISRNLGSLGPNEANHAHTSVSSNQDSSAKRGDEIPYGVGIPILLFHRVDKKSDPFNPYLTTQDRLREIFQIIKNAGYQTVSIFDLLAYYKGEKNLPKKSFLLTFDDGYKSNLNFVDPLLEEFGFHAVLFLNVYMQEKKKSGYLDWDELEILYENGRWDLQAHGYQYHSTIPVNADGVEAEFAGNLMWLDSEKRLETLEEYRKRLYNDLTTLKTILENRFKGNRIVAFAFPFGEIGYSTVNLNPSLASAINYAVVKELFLISFSRNITDPSQYYLSSAPQLIVRFEDTNDVTPSTYLHILQNAESGVVFDHFINDHFNCELGAVF